MLKMTSVSSSANGFLRKTVFIIACTTCWLSAYSEDINISMRRAFESFRSLQPYLVDSQRFEDTKNDTAVYNLIASLRGNFHGISTFPTRFQSEPGFASNVGIVSDTLDDAAKRFSDGRKGYAAWRLRGISQNCLSCHATYNVKLAFEDTRDPDLKGLNNMQKGEFFLATRQLETAEKYFRQALLEVNGTVEPMNILRRLLVLYVRIKQDPTLALIRIEEATKGIHLPRRDQEDVDLWLTSLRSWSAHKNEIMMLDDAKSLIKRSISEQDLLESRTDVIGILRATTALHALVRQPNFPLSDRSQAFYLLGLSYSKLPLFFIDELPELYLRQCIEESPNSAIAKSAYRLYEDIVQLGFTGSGGTQLPTDKRLKLMELHDKAYGILHVAAKT